MAHDVIIRNGTVVDGTGAPARVADVAIDGERITAIGDLGDATAAREIAASIEARWAETAVATLVTSDLPGT